ncbi:MAG: hypothetical protein NC336_10395, partial [Clostridium sp.]|nr:hypothetical protein [Clostridium sp.]
MMPLNYETLKVLYVEFLIEENLAWNFKDFDHIKEYSEMCDKHGADAVDDYMEFHDELDNFEEAYMGEWD